MAHKGELIKVNRNTAVLAGGVLQTPAASMSADTIAEGNYLFSFDPTNPENEHLVFKCNGKASREWTQHTVEPFLMENWAVKKITLAGDEPDTKFPALRVVLIDPDGEVLAFVSTGVVQSLDLIRTFRGDGPYVPPVPVIVVPVQTRSKFTALTIEPWREPKADKKVK